MAYIGIKVTGSSHTLVPEIDRGSGNSRVGMALRSICKMARRGEVRILITLGCTDCRERTYNSSKNRRNDPQRLELKKFCPRCRKHTMHREVR